MGWKCIKCNIELPNRTASSVKYGDYRCKSCNADRRRMEERKNIVAKPGFFYMLDFGEFVKIGITKNWDIRRKVYDALPWKYELKSLTWMKNANIAEIHISDSWNKFRINSSRHGEWFRKRNVLG